MIIMLGANEANMSPAHSQTNSTWELYDETFIIDYCNVDKLPYLCYRYHEIFTMNGSRFHHSQACIMRLTDDPTVSHSGMCIFTGSDHIFGRVSVLKNKLCKY